MVYQEISQLLTLRQVCDLVQNSVVLGLGTASIAGGWHGEEGWAVNHDALRGNRVGDDAG